MREVGTAQALELRIEIGEIAALQQRVVGEIDARRHVLGHERDLFGFGEEIVWHAIEYQAANRLWFQDLFWNDLSWIEDVEVEAIGECLVEELDLQLPFGKIARLDSIPQIAAMEIRIGSPRNYHEPSAPAGTPDPAPAWRRGPGRGT